jgi:peptide/nickel transport system permease protein
MRSQIPVFLIAALLVALAVAGPWLAPHDPNLINIPARLSGPSDVYPLGTDTMGRCLLSRLLHGARWSLGLAFLTSLIGLVAGSMLGLAAALGGRATDSVVMRVSDIFLAFPELVAAVTIAGVLGASTASLIIAMTVTGWMRYARMTRGIGLTVQSRGYVVQARLSGLGITDMTRFHYLPALLPSLTVVWTGMFGRAILAISALGFLGFGVQPPTAEWGTMLLDARVHMRADPLQMLWPGLAILLTVLSINLAGDHLRDTLAQEEKTT